MFYRRDTPKDALELVCHGLLIETDRDRLVLVDPGSIKPATGLFAPGVCDASERAFPLEAARV